MLYVKQKIEDLLFIIADTDDNSDEVCSYEKLKHCVIDIGLEIVGTTLDSDGKFKVHCYNNLTDAKALKLKVLYGVSLFVDSKHTLCNMLYDSNRDIKYTVNLEDWCSSLADYCFEDMYVGDFPVDITVILSDKIKFNSKAFKSCSASGLKFNFLQLSDEKAKIAYEQFLIARGSCLVINQKILESNVKIVDKQERYTYYVILKSLIQKDATNFYAVQKLTPKRLYYSTIEEIINLYRPKWIEICNSNIKLDLQGQQPILRVERPNLTNVSTILTVILSFGINIDKFVLSMIEGYLDFVCTADFDLVNSIMALGKRLKMMYNL